MIIQCIAGNEGLDVQPNLQSKAVTPSASNQYVYPSDGYDGLSSVTVNGDSNLKASNIKEGVEIFGVTGTYSTDVTTTYKLPMVCFQGNATNGFSYSKGNEVEWDYTEPLVKPVITSSGGYSTITMTTDSSGKVKSWSNGTEQKITVNQKSWTTESSYSTSSFAGGYFMMPAGLTVTTSTFWGDSPTKLPKGKYVCKITNFGFASGEKIGWMTSTGLYWTNSSYTNAVLTVTDTGATCTWTIPSTWTGWYFNAMSYHGYDDYYSVYGETYINLYAQLTQVVSYTAT